MWLVSKYKLWQHKRRRRALRRGIVNFQYATTRLMGRASRYDKSWLLCAEAYTKAGILLDTFELREEG